MDVKDVESESGGRLEFFFILLVTNYLPNFGQRFELGSLLLCFCL